MSLLDQALPRWDFNEVHETFVAAPPAAVLDAARAVTTREVRVLAPLMAIRLSRSRSDIREQAAGDCSPASSAADRVR